MLVEQMLGAIVAFVDDAADFLVDRLRGLVRHVALAVDRIAEEHFLIGVGVLQGAEEVRHAPAGDHVAGEAGRIADVGRGAGRHLVVAEDQLLGDAAAHRHREVGVHLVPVIAVIVALGQAHDHAQCAAARDDRRLVNRV